MTTEIVIIVITVLILVWDGYLYADKKDGNSITQVVIKWSTKIPFIPFVFGFLMGHLFG